MSTPTVFAGLQAAVVALLQQDPPVAHSVLTNLRRQLPVDVPSAVIVRVRQSSAQPFGVLDGPVDWSTTLELEVLARDTTAATADAAADAVLARVYQRLAADPTLDDRVIDLRPTALDYDLAAEADNLVAITLSITAEQRTANASLE
jgi:hypothetical protein